jgi:mycofactocin precursor peptide peptidase
MSTRLSHLSWPEVPTRPLVLVPVGSFEQHGPHLPFDTDTTIAVAVAEGAAARLPHRCLVAPPIGYAASGEHQSFPGTISIGDEALRSVLIELVRSLATWCGRVVFVNAHGGNLRSLSGAVGRLRRERHQAAWVACEPENADAHAGFTETSLMLHLAPDLVNTARAVAGNTAPLADLMPVMVASGVAAVSPSGVLGDPATATAGDGARLLRQLVENVCALVADGEADADGRLRARSPEAGR